MTRSSADLRVGLLGRPSLGQRSVRYAVFFATYLYQGLVAGFSLTALANHLAARGVPATEVGLHFALTGLPWTLQPLLWGPWVDRAGDTRMGRRRPFAVAALVGCHATLALLLIAGGDAVGALGPVFLVHSLFASLLDTACDRMIMDHVPTRELGRVSACTRAGFVAGTSLSAAVFGWTLANWGFAASARWLLVAALVASLPMLLVREAPADPLWSLERRGPAPRRLPFRRFLRRTVIALRRPRALRLLALCFGLDAALGLFELPFSIDLLQRQGWEAASLSRLQAFLTLVSGTAGAVAVGLWSDRAGAASPLRALLLGSAVTFVLAGILIGAGLVGAAAPAILALTSVLPGLLIVALMPALLAASRGRPGAATQFEVYMAAMNLGSVAGTAVAGWLAPVLPLQAIAALVAATFFAAFRMAGRGDLLGARR
ncbi:MFS transporter, PAT family, beta-lactamase induction signal transducer AmpG [Methylobacterium sp. 275MFSha3.1]|uniref:MFS transporter n=1 Tax=Methylobacterium sp. 275MFSha3.1 TaxID=1502746 RepID=UPI0008A7460F|nr:MFS transporter [Methylobacterium sp. 275MFSha3.1]SEH34128.1 MFS transporter, PAT family, beta-lactamase induction signal transducer AmpG [Methylobacterium sp. 275MFSha3.1]